MVAVVSDLVASDEVALDVAVLSWTGYLKPQPTATGSRFGNNLDKPRRKPYRACSLEQDCWLSHVLP
jgi:hypothetical protein